MELLRELVLQGREAVRTRRPGDKASGQGQQVPLRTPSLLRTWLDGAQIYADRARNLCLLARAAERADRPTETSLDRARALARPIRSWSHTR